MGRRRFARREPRVRVAQRLSCVTVAEFEFEVPGIYEPCRKWCFDDGGYCLNTQRAIEFMDGNSGKKLVCGRGHAIEHNGKTFIPGWEFDEGGQFDGILPDDLLPTQTRIKQSRWKISRGAPIHRRKLTKCVRCKAPPYELYGGADPARAWAWLAKHAPEIIEAIHTQLRVQPGADLAQWFGEINDDLRKKVIKRLTLSALAIDHGVPRKVGDRLWLLLSVRERTFLQISLLLRLCRRCNAEKSSTLLPRDELEGLFVATYYDGSIAAARVDAARWTLLSEVLAKVYHEEQLG